MHRLRLSKTTMTLAQPALRLPDFFIIGSAKSGTTTLYSYLCRHPDIFMSTPKEMNFFSKDNVYERGLEWYASTFAGASENQLCGEASTTYSRWPLYGKSAERLAAARPDARLIYIVRDPVDRIYSFYAHRMRREVTTTFDDFLCSTPEAIDTGRYMTQLNQYLEFFPAEQILVLFTQELNNSPVLVLNKTCRFLGLEQYDFLSNGCIQANEGGGKPYATVSLTKAISAFKRVPGIAPLMRSIPSTTRHAGFNWLANGQVGNYLRKRHQQRLTQITPLLRRKIFDLYRDDIQQLEAFTGRSLDEWMSHAPENGKA